MFCIGQDVVRSLYCDFKPWQNILTNFKFLNMSVRFVSLSLDLPQSLKKKIIICKNNLRCLLSSKNFSLVSDASEIQLIIRNYTMFHSFMYSTDCHYIKCATLAQSLASLPCLYFITHKKCSIYISRPSFMP